MFKKGTVIVDENGILEYIKIDNQDYGTWLCLNSNYLIEKKVKKEVLISKEDIDIEVEDEELDLSKFKKVLKDEIEHELRPESEKPLFRNGKLNRNYFRWNDRLVKKEYENIGYIFDSYKNYDIPKEVLELINK